MHSAGWNTFLASTLIFVTVKFLQFQHEVQQKFIQLPMFPLQCCSLLQGMKNITTL